MKQISLDHVAYGEYELNENEKDSLKQLLSKGCRANTKRLLYGRIDYININAKLIPYNYRTRVTFKDNKCEYIAGQDYVQEIRDIRKFLLK